MAGSVALVGFGYWGPNLARNLQTEAGAAWRYLVEASAERRDQARTLYPHLEVTADLDKVLGSADVAAVVVATPAATHVALARRVLAAGKHVLVEKPLALRAADAVELARNADDRGLVLMVGHTFEFVPAVQKMKELITLGTVGEVLYLHTQRLNLGRIQADINAFWSIGPHDVSIANYLLGNQPRWVSARGARYLHDDLEDVVFVAAEYPGAVLAHMHVSWLDPCKTRRTTVVGSERMLVFDDLDPGARLKVFDKGVGPGGPDAHGKWLYELREGPTWVPDLSATEPLAAEVRHFLECVATGKRPQADGWNGARVVAVLEAVDTSLRAGGAQTAVSLPGTASP